MLINKKCIGAFAKKHPYLGMATTPKLIDQDFSVKSELMVMDYFSGETLASIYVEMMFSKIIWCETETKTYLAAVHEKGEIYLYEYLDHDIKLVMMKKFFKEEIVSIDYLAAKSILVAGSNAGKIGFWVIKELKDVYKLDINLPKNISCIACNQKITKILCVGTSNGNIEVIDLKKNKVIMKLGVPNVHGIRNIVWGGEKGMKLIVMSEKEYLTEFDLTDNSVKRINEGNSAIIGFNSDIVVYEKYISSNGYIQKINETYDCSLAENEKMVLLSHSDGTTEIVNVCAVKRHDIIGRRKNIVVMPNGNSNMLVNSEIIIEKRKVGEEARKKEKFYDGIVNLVENNAGKHEIAEYILSGARTSERLELDETNKNLIRGIYDDGKKLELKVDFKFLVAILQNETAYLEKAKDFPVLLVLSRIMKNYKTLGQLDNAKVVASILLFDEVDDLSPLSFNREARCLQSLLNGAIDTYIANRVDFDSDYMDIMSLMDSVVKQSSSLLTGPVEDPAIVEYFWYKVFLGELEDLKNINFKNPKIDVFLKALVNDKPALSQLENSSVILQKNNANWESNFTTGKPFYKNIIQNFNNASSMQSQPATSQPRNTSQNSAISHSVNNVYFSKQTAPLNFSNVTQNNNNFPEKVNTPPDLPKTSPGNNNYIDSSLKRNFSTTYNSFAYNGPQAESNFVNSNQTNIYPNIKSNTISSPEMPIKQGAPTMKTEGFKIQSPSMPVRSVLNNSSASFNYKASPNHIPTSLITSVKNLHTIPQANPSPMFSTSQNSNVSSEHVIPQPSNIGFSNFASNNNTESTNTGFLNSSNMSSSQFSNMNFSQHSSSENMNHSQILNNFENLIISLKEKAAKNNSLIIRARKLQSLNLLDSYYNVNKSTIPDSVYKTIDAICTRVKNPDSKLKIDIEILVVSEIECPWLKAAAELIKMLY